jgi:glycosyltransferase involved in cell wall biosynthesis
MAERSELGRPRLRVCMVTPHLPPEQAANALLPVLLARELAQAGIETDFVAHPPASGVPAAAGNGFGRVRVAYVPRRGRRWLDRTAAGAAVAAVRIALGAHPLLARADLVHLHSNGLIVEVAGTLVRRRGVPYIVTLYGTDVWHHDPRRHRRFAAVVQGAAHRVFYSRALLEFAELRGLAPAPASVIYAPVAPAFRRVADHERRELRERFGAGEGPLVVTVKRLHPVAGYEDLLHALPAIVRAVPGLRLFVAGDGPLRSSLEAAARALGVAAHVRFLGAVPNEMLWQYLAAADLFVLPSRLESWGTVMLEALACGTPVVATATAGAVEVQSHFPDDVTVCAREDPAALAAAVLAVLGARRRAGEATEQILRARFSPAACAAQYRAVYESVVVSTNTGRPA